MTAEQLQILRHMLGIDTPNIGNPKPYRDYYCASRGDMALLELERIGVVQKYRQCEHYDWYCTTPAGRSAAIASHKKIRKPKAKRVYALFLNIRDVYADLTFREFLMNQEFSDVRAGA